MKNLSKLAVLGAALAVSSSFAFGDQIGSYATGQSNLGNVNTALNYAGFVAGPSSCCAGFATNPIASGDGSVGTNNSVMIGAGAPWANAQPGSTWVSYTAGTNPASGPAVIAAQGYYTFTTTFSEATSGTYSINLGLLADDTTAVYFNNGSGNLMELAAGPLGNDAACADGGGVNCETVTPLSFSSLLTGGATNTLTFVVEQTGHQDLGLDFVGSVGQTPEPSSLMLLGTGLTSVAGMLFRRRRTA